MHIVSNIKRQATKNVTKNVMLLNLLLLDSSDTVKYRKNVFASFTSKIKYKMNEMNH